MQGSEGGVLHVIREPREGKEVGNKVSSQMGMLGTKG